MTMNNVDESPDSFFIVIEAALRRRSAVVTERVTCHTSNLGISNLSLKVNLKSFQ